MRPSQAAPPSLALTTLTCLLLLACGFVIYGSTGHDDSHINFWNVHTLLTRGELVNYNGERVEQTTSLLQDLLTAAVAGLFPVHLVTVGYLVDIVSALGCCLLGTILARQQAPGLAGWMPWLALSSSSFLLWSFGGMGAPLAAFVLLICIYNSWQWLVAGSVLPRHWLMLAGTTVALTLVRPEMPIVASAFSAALVLVYWHHPAQRRRAAILFASAAGGAGLLFLWQHYYFGSWLPIPAVAKQGGDFLPQLARGTRYLLLGSLLNPVIPLALLVSTLSGWALLRQWHQQTLTADKALTAVLLLVLWAYSGFVWTAGGDWMQAARFLVPVILPAGIILLQHIALLPWRWLSHLLLATVVITQSGIQYPVVATTSHGIPLWVQTRILPEHAQRYSIFEQLNQEHVRDMHVIDHLATIIPVLHSQLQRPVQLMSGQAGMVFYYTAHRFAGHVHFRDLRGLVESSLTLCPLLRDIPRSPQGLYWGYNEFFERLPALEQQCGIVRPDIIYDLNDIYQKLGRTLEPHGYTMIHQETGLPVENRSVLPYNRLLTPNMIFVRNELLPLLGNPQKTIVDYSQLPLQARWPFHEPQSTL